MTCEPTEMPCVFRPPPLHQIARAAWADPGVRAQAIEALERFRGYCSRPLPRDLGCGTGKPVGHPLLKKNIDDNRQS